MKYNAAVAGMLHDVGKLVIASELPKLFADIKRVQSESHVSEFDAEQNVLGVSHAEIGAYLLSVWGLPYSIVEAVAYHHQPTRVINRAGLGVLEAVHIADGASHRDRP